MKRALFIIGAIVAWQVAAWAFAPPPPVLQKPREIDPQTLPNEKYIVEGRKLQRHDGLRALDVPRSSLCSEEGRKKFISGLGHYYYHRSLQTTSYPKNYGKTGADYIARQWSTADDKRIDRLTKEIYSSGYFKPNEFGAGSRDILITLVKDERVNGKGCVR